KPQCENNNEGSRMRSRFRDNFKEKNQSKEIVIWKLRR
ncbi:hypothetical protein Leryth_021106, partial [Lithospermum erythrorhizon]